MRFRHVLAVTAALLLSAASLAALPARATFVLSDGTRMSGTLVFHTEAQTNIRADKNEFNLKVQDGTEVPIPFDHVIAIDFVGGQPDDAALAAAPADGTHLLAMRNGELREGKLEDFIRGETVKWTDKGGATREIPIDQVSRILLKGDRAREVYNYTGPVTPGQIAGGQTGVARTRSGRVPGGVAAAPSRPGMTALASLDVNARTAWTPTAVTVEQGEVLEFDTSGQISFSPDPQHVSGPEGSDVRQGREEGLPLENAPVGALIGRVGLRGQPFLIGAGENGIVMPASGRLFLAVNDDGHDDNSGAFRVAVYRR